MTSRRYIKRIWRVPKHRGAAEAFVTIVCKALRKHGWPADWRPLQVDQWRLQIFHKFEADPPPDFLEQVAIAVRIAARTYRVEVDFGHDSLELSRSYVVTPTGHFIPWEKWFANHRKVALRRAQNSKL